MLKPLLKFRISVRFVNNKLNCPVLFYIWNSDCDLAEHTGSPYYAVTVDRALINKGKTIEVHLSMERLSLAYVCHEVFHVVIFWANRHGVTVQEDSKNYVHEERCASLHGAIVQKFYEKLVQLKFIEVSDFFSSKKYPRYKFIGIN